MHLHRTFSPNLFRLHRTFLHLHRTFRPNILRLQVTGIRILIASGVVRWIDKEAHTHGIHALRIAERQDIGNVFAVLIKPCRIGCLVGRQQRNVTAKKALGMTAQSRHAQHYEKS